MIANKVNTSFSPLKSARSAARHGAGEALWGEPAQRQPIAVLVVMAFVLLLVAAPSALGGAGGSSNPLVLMRQVADSTWELTGLMKQSNKSLASIESNSSNLITVQGHMLDIAKATSGMEANTEKLNDRLGGVSDSVVDAGASLQRVDTKLNATASGMGQLKGDVSGSAASTRSVLGEFSKIDSAIGEMDASLRQAIGQMKASGPLVQEFAGNRTRVSIAGGSSSKYGVPNIDAGTPVMSVVLPMIHIMQEGGMLATRKDSHVASNPIVGTALKMQVPDGTNVVAIVKPYDGWYGLPNQQFFVGNRVHGF